MVAFGAHGLIPESDGEPVLAAEAGTQQRSRHTLKGRALGLLAALAALLATEIGLGVAVIRNVELGFQRAAELDAVQRELLFGVSGISDLIADVAFDRRFREDRGALGHWLGHLAVLNELGPEAEARVGPDGLAQVRSLIERTRDLLAVKQLTHDSLVSLSEEIEDQLTTYGNLLLQRVSAVQDERQAVLAVSANQRRWLVFTMVAVGSFGLGLLAVGGGLFVARLIRALEQLRRQTERIGRGDYEARSTVTGDDEVAQVTEAVNAMAAGLSARDRELAGMRANFGQQERMFAMGVFAAQMAHELGNPIQAIMALCLHTSESLREDSSPRNVLSCVDNINLIADHAERLTGTVRDIREFARPERLERELIDVNELVDRSIRLMRFEPRFKRVKVQLDLAPDLMPVHGVADHLTQVLLNLLINASDAVEKVGGTISVATRWDRDKVSLSVADDGQGMEPAVRDLVFDPFFTTKLSGNGTGLGLTICKRIVDDHGGDITIDSTVGRGTTVTVILPKGAGS